LTALEERTHDRVPLQWAGTNMNLGNALRTLGERESDTAHLEEAVAACRAALVELKRELMPLDWARAEQRAFVTFNVAHFAALHGIWLRQGRHHAGIVLSSQRPVGDLVRRLLRLTAALDSEAMSDRLEFLSDW